MSRKTHRQMTNKQRLEKERAEQEESLRRLARELHYYQRQGIPTPFPFTFPTDHEEDAE